MFRNTFKKLGTLAIATLVMSGALLGQAPAATAATSPPAPICVIGWKSLVTPFNKTKCTAKGIWNTMNTDAIKVGAENNKEKRVALVMKHYWAIGAPLAFSQKNQADRVKYLNAFNVGASKLREKARSGKGEAKEIIVSMRDYVAVNQTQTNNMEAAANTLHLISKTPLSGPILSKNIKNFSTSNVSIVKGYASSKSAESFLIKTFLFH
jgi:hypothetical protein